MFVGDSFVGLTGIDKDKALAQVLLHACHHMVNTHAHVANAHCSMYIQCLMIHYNCE